MINVNQITAQLARMPDQALQQYAQMHKGDPYTLSLALAESNRRKQMRQGAQMQAQEQPKVVDQELQGMAAPMPEDVGIAQLPSGDMNYAEGGIVAFSDGGDVPRYQSQGLVDTFSLGASPEAIEKRKQAMLRAMLEETRKGRQEIAQGTEYSPENYGVTKPAPLVPGARGAFFQAAQQPADAAPKPDTAPRLRVPPTGGPGSRLPAGPTAPAAPPAGLPAVAPATAAPNLDAAALMDAALKQAEGAKHPYAKELGDVGQAKVKAAEERVAGLEAIQKQFSDIYKGRKERLDTKEAELGKLKDQGTGLALLQAGAAMMSTPGSFGTALGRGVKVGTEQYAAGLDKLRAAQDRLSDARDRLEEIEAQRGELSARELFKARSEVKDVGIGAREDLVKANMQMYGLKREEAIKRVDLQIKVGLSQFEQGEQTKRSEAEQRGQTQRAQIGAGAQQNFYEALGRAAPDSPLAKGYASAKEADKIPRLYGEYTKLVADPMNGSAFEQKYPTFEAFLSAMGGGRSAGFVKPPANAPVLRAPGT